MKVLLLVLRPVVGVALAGAAALVLVGASHRLGESLCLCRGER